LLADPSADSVRAVTAPSQNPFKMWRTRADGALTPLLAVDGMAEPYNAARQTLPDVWWQTGHVDVCRRDTVRVKHSLTGSRILPIEVPRATVADIDTETDWAIAEGLLRHTTLDLVVPAHTASPLPGTIAAVVLDFDGVLTDDRVWTEQDGRESVASSRADGYGVERLRQSGVPVVVLSRETNAVVAARCLKLGIECVQAVLDKGPALRALMDTRRWAAANVVYVGNDVTDLDCLALAGCGVAVADAHPAVRAAARLVLTRPGGRGAVRELSDMILQHQERTTS
jgi:N-acylneuraminate cytidylyltransferase